MLDVKKQIDVDVQDQDSYLTDEGLIEFGALVSQARIRLQITQKRLSELTGYAETKVSNLERGIFKGMTHTEARRIAHVLRLNVDELLREYKHAGSRKWGVANQQALIGKPRVKPYGGFTVIQEKSIRIDSHVHSISVKEVNGDWSVTIKRDGQEKCSLFGNTKEDSILIGALQEAFKALSKSL